MLTKAIAGATSTHQDRMPQALYPRAQERLPDAEREGVVAQVEAEHGKVEPELHVLDTSLAVCFIEDICGS